MNPGNPLLASLVAFLLFILFSTPWILFRLGYIKGIYIVPRLPPVIWWKGIYGWPTGIVFVAPTISYFFGIKGDLTFASYLSSAGLLAAIIMIVFTPNWAKPKWLRCLEGKYSYREIRRYIPVWWQMSKEWVQLMDSEKGIDEAVCIAREKLEDSVTIY